MQVKENFLDQLEYRRGQLQHNPELGSTFENTHYRRLIIHKTISLYYVDKPDYIKILIIWDNRSDPDLLLQRLTDASNR